MHPIQGRLVKRMRELCAARGLVFSHLPDLAGLGRTHFWAVVKGDSSPTLKWMCAVAEALDVDVAELVRPPTA